MAGVLGKIGSKVVQGGRAVVSPTGQAVIGGALGAAGVLGATKYIKPPQAMTQTKYLGDMMFPGDLIDPSANRNSYISIKFQEYQRRSIFDQPFMRLDGGIRLPLPYPLSENQQIQYDSSHSSEPAQGAAIEAGLAARSGGGGFGNIAAAAAGGAAAGAISKATAGIGAALGIDVPQALQLGGLAQNPFLTVLFQAPQFKRHTFSWKLAPNNQQESNTVRDIINAFKSNMLPAMSGNAGGTLLTYPNMAIINLYPDETFLYKFKPCVIESLNVNYAVGGQPSFFKNTNAPTIVQIDVNFLEIEYWLKEDIEDSSFRAGGRLF